MCFIDVAVRSSPPFSVARSPRVISVKGPASGIRCSCIGSCGSQTARLWIQVEGYAARAVQGPFTEESVRNQRRKMRIFLSCAAASYSEEPTRPKRRMGHQYLVRLQTTNTYRAIVVVWEGKSMQATDLDTRLRCRPVLAMGVSTAVSISLG